MGSYNFKWSHPDNREVYVTGTFDDWSKSIKLDKKGEIHEKRVDLPNVEKYLFKFVVDGEWKLDHTHKTEADHEGNLNNVLYPEEIMPSDSTAHTLSSVAPGATTTELAGKQPLEKDGSADLPGTFPETPAATKDDEQTNGLSGAAVAAGLIGAGAGGIGAAAASGKKDEEQTFSVNPIPASQGAGNPVHLQPGEKVPEPSTINNNTITSTVRDDPELKAAAEGSEQTFSVNPIPSTGGTSNPIHLQPGEPVPDPSTISRSTVDSNVKLDQASYEKSDAGAPVLPPGGTSDAEPATAGGVLLGGLGPQTTNMIPESSMGMGSDAPAPLEGAALSSVGANSTTNELAGQVPLEPRGVPTVVTESQKEAGEAPEAAANPEAVQEKKEVENELKKTVPLEQPTTSANQGGITGAIAGGATAAGAAVIGAAAVAREKTTKTTGKDPVSVLPASVQKTVDENTKPAATTADAVPTEVKESQKEAHVAPEASANPEAVHEKSDVEKELLAKVPESHASGEPAPTATAATTTTAPVASTTSASGAPQLAATAGLAALSLDDDSKGLNAPADAPAQSSSTHATAVAEANKPLDSRDVSPMSKPNTAAQTAPTVTTGVDSGTAPAQSTSTPVGTPRKGGPSTPSNKRNSIIDRLKGTPDSEKNSTDASGSAKKKGLFTRIKEKLKN